MSDPWQDESDAEDDWEEQPTGPAGGSSLDPEELDAEGDDSDLGDDELDDDAA